MAFRVLTSPVRLAGSIRLAHLVALTAADVLVRHARARGEDTEWLAAALAGDLAEQHAVERELAREGLDRAALGRDEFVARVRAFEAESRARAGEILAALGVEVDLEAGALDGDIPTRAARTAFVQLYEAGLLERAHRVVGTCPRCETVVDPADVEEAASPADVIVVRVVDIDGRGELDVYTSTPELLPGAVAVLVPVGHPAEGWTVTAPLAGVEAPVIAADDGERPRFVIPAHDQADLELARARGLHPVEVLHVDGSVLAAGPLHGLARFAARAAARELLEAEGVVTAAEEVESVTPRCRRCGTALVPRLGRHWFLPMGDLETAAVDAVRQGTLGVSPPAVRERLIDAAGVERDWCLSHQVWAGQPVPVATCMECGNVTVSAETPESCGKCMGELVPDDDVLDARFIGAVWALAASGWPDEDRGPATVLVVSPSGIRRWALPMAALGLRLSGAVPFRCVAVQELTVTPDEPDPLVEDVEALLAQDPRVVRLALLGGGLDPEPAMTVVAALDADPPAGDGATGPERDASAAAVAAALDACTPGAAIASLADAPKSAGPFLAT